MESDSKELEKLIQRVTVSIQKSFQGIRQDALIAIQNSSLNLGGAFDSMTRGLEALAKASLSESLCKKIREASKQSLWTIPMEMSVNQVNEIYSNGDEEGIFLQFFECNDGAEERQLMDTLLNSQELKHWMPLVQEVVEAYNNKSYIICVPALFTILEGVVKKNLDGGIKSTLTRVIGPSEKKLKDGSLVGIEVAVWSSIVGFLEGTFGASRFDEEPPVKLNRHWVLHGRQSPAWGKVDCLKLMNAISLLG